MTTHTNNDGVVAGNAKVTLPALYKQDVSSLLTPRKLDGINYVEWAFNAQNKIQGWKCWGFISDEVEQQAFRRKTRKRLIIVVVSSVVLLAAIIGAVIGVVVHNRNNNSSSNPVPPPELTPAASLKAVCSVTRKTTDPEVLFKLSLHVAINELSKLKDYPDKLIQSIDDATLQDALKVCATVFDDAVDRLNDSISSMAVGEGGKILSTAKMDDLKTWISTTIV
uniref:Pectinesterase inhibitor domain-containing protein n=1 Tax=Populus alba TaxID=43335 RepID=A0A4U5P3S0_POPAL|nr:hypothetical protein D5086_0000234000 [Populus alba]